MVGVAATANSTMRVECIFTSSRSSIDATMQKQATKLAPEINNSDSQVSPTIQLKTAPRSG